MFLAIVFTIFAYSGWEATGPVAEESRNPKKLIPLGLIGSVLILMVYEVFASWGYLVGIGTSKVGTVPAVAAWPVATLAQRVWAGAWILLLFALLNSTIAVSIACFNGGQEPGTRWDVRACSRFNLLRHAVIPVAASVAVGYVGYKSVVPLPAPPVKWAPIIFVVYMVIGAAILAYLRIRGREQCVEKAGLAMAEPEEPA